MKEYFFNKRSFIVEGANTLFGIGTDLLSNAQNVARIICPTKNCFEKYKIIKDKINKNSFNIDIIILSIEPTATILAKDLRESSRIQCLDLGSFATDYYLYVNKIKKYTD